MSTIEQRLRELGLELPEPPARMANYISCVQTGQLLYTSGAGCYVNGSPLFTGRLGSDVTIEQGYAAARITVLNLLSIVKAEIGDLDRISRFIKLLCFVSSAPDFYQQPQVMNGASDLLVDIFGENGRHTRSAVGTSVLPFNNPIEIEAIIELKPD